MKGKHHERYSVESLGNGEQDSKGKIFVSGMGMVDLSSLLIVGETVDTVRQLYKGKTKEYWVNRIEEALENRVILENNSPAALPWTVSRMGKQSGYQYKLQNNEEGAVILYKSFYKEDDKEGAHLKIELSPKFIYSRGKKHIQQWLNLIASTLLESPKASGVAVHLALDIQGWVPSENLSELFVTRSRSVIDYRAIRESSIEDLSRVSVSYGNGESWLFGKSNSLQTAIYRKDIEIKVSDKEDHFHRVWDVHSMGVYDKEKPVWRVEARFHHQVVRELGLSQNEKFEDFLSVSEYLTDLWKYALKNNRLDMSPTYIDQAWQLFMEDPEFYHPSVGFFFKRAKKQSAGNTVKNYGQIIGNLISVCARHHMKANQVYKQIKRLDVWDDLLSSYKSVGKSESDIIQMIEKGLCLRRLVGKAA